VVVRMKLIYGKFYVMFISYIQQCGFTLCHKSDVKRFKAVSLHVLHRFQLHAYKLACYCLLLFKGYAHCAQNSLFSIPARKPLLEEDF